MTSSLFLVKVFRRNGDPIKATSIDINYLLKYMAVQTENSISTAYRCTRKLFTAPRFINIPDEYKEWRSQFQKTYSLLLDISKNVLSWILGRNVSILCAVRIYKPYGRRTNKRFLSRTTIFRDKK